MRKRAKYLLDAQNRHSGSGGHVTKLERWHRGVECTGPSNANGPEIRWGGP